MAVDIEGEVYAVAGRSIATGRPKLVTRADYVRLLIDLYERSAAYAGRVTKAARCKADSTAGRIKALRAELAELEAKEGAQQA